MARELVPNNPLAERLQLVLQGRPLSTWAKQVGLSSGTVTRLWAGSPPDPRKLIPAARFENMALGWLFDGVGTPYMVRTLLSDEHAADVLAYELRESPAADVLVVWSPVGFTPIIHERITAETDGFGYTYQRVQVIAGGICRQAVVSVLTQHAARFNTAKRDRIRLVNVYDTFQRDLATGGVGNYLVFEKGEEALINRSKPLGADATLSFHGMTSGVRDISSYTMSSEQIQLRAAYDSLVGEDRAIVMRLIQGLLAVPHVKG